MSRDVTGCHSWAGLWHRVGRDRDAVKHPAMPGTARDSSEQRRVAQLQMSGVRMLETLMHPPHKTNLVSCKPVFANLCVREHKRATSFKSGVRWREETSVKQFYPDACVF